MTSIELRPATPEDAGHLTKFVNMAGEGLPLYLWQKNAPEGMDPWDYGLTRACDPKVGFNWRNAQLALADGQVAGGIATYQIADEPEPIGPDMPAMFVPLMELENLAAGTRYINILAVYEQFRRLGIGRRLMQHVGTVAQGRDQSLIVENANSGAQALYAGLGFEVVASRPIVDGGWGATGDEFVLMIRKQRQ
jgi:ribosomal protein S18 acetylase RimI-like enzyme